VQAGRTLAAALDEISLGEFLQVVEEGLRVEEALALFDDVVL
jgi:hypothetical protein